MKSLTVKRVERLREPGRYSDGHGLYLQVVNENNRSWIFRWERAGRERAMGLGPVHTFSLEEARQLARDARQLLRRGIDPIDARRGERTAHAEAVKTRLTFREAAVRYNDMHEREWTNAKHRQQFLGSLTTYAFPALADMSVAAIDTPAVLRAIEPHWLTKTETASRVRGRIEAVLDWATARGYRAGDNPARWEGHLDQVLPARSKIAKVEHHPALPSAELPAFVVELRKREGIAARALEFLILTCARTGEVTGALWPEIDLAAALWTIPAERMKGRREHRVPLSKPALALLQALPTEDGNEFVFIGSQPGAGLSSAGMTQVLRRMKRPDISVHGFRSTFRSWAAAETNFPREAAELALAHSVGDKVEQAYQRGDLFKKRVRLADVWGRFCTSPPAEPARGGAKILPMRGAR